MPKRDIFADTVNRGPLSEWSIEQILIDWRRDKKILNFFIHPSLDERGIDVLIVLNNGLALLVQLKTNSSDIKEHRRKHPAVKFVFVVKNFPRHGHDMAALATLEHRFKKALNGFLKGAVRSEIMAIS